MSPRSMRLASSTSCAAVSSGWRPASRRNSCSASVVVSCDDRRRRRRRRRGLLLLGLGLRDLDPALLELAEDGVRLERVEVQRLEHLDQLGIAKRPVLLRLFEQVVQLGSRQHVLDLDRGHPCNLASCHEARPPKPLLAARCSPRMHDNGRYVKLRHGASTAAPPRPPRLGPKKFAESVSVSSTVFADLPLAGTAFELGFDLLRFRARRKRESRGPARPGSRASKHVEAAICGNSIIHISTAGRAACG